MQLITKNIVDGVEDVLGTKISSFFKKKRTDLRPFMEFQGLNFKLNEIISPVVLSKEDSIFDLGGKQPNESWIAGIIKSFDDSILKAIQAKINEGKIKNISGLIVTHRFLDSGASKLSNTLIFSNFTALFCCVENEVEGSYKSIMVDNSGVKIFKGKNKSLNSFKKDIENRFLHRDDLRDVDLDAVFAIDVNKFQRIPIIRRSQIILPYPIFSKDIKGGNQERVAIAGIHNPPPPPLGNETSPSQTVTKGKRVYSATISGIIDISKTGYSGGGSAPNGYVWGDPTGVATCGNRDAHDECVNCCSNIMLAYSGAAFTTGITIVASTGVETLGLGALAGIAVGLFIGLIGFIHSSICHQDCDQLYNKRTGDAVKRGTFQLVAAKYDDNEEQVAYEVYDKQLKVSAIWSRETVYQLLFVGIQVTIGDDDDMALVQLVHRKGIGFYMRSTPDKTKINNLQPLPPIN